MNSSKPLPGQLKALETNKHKTSPSVIRSQPRNQVILQRRLTTFTTVRTAVFALLMRIIPRILDRVHRKMRISNPENDTVKEDLTQVHPLLLTLLLLRLVRPF